MLHQSDIELMAARVAKQMKNFIKRGKYTYPATFKSKCDFLMGYFKDENISMVEAKEIAKEMDAAAMTAYKNRKKS